ncbi:MAG: sulfotransferase domain-containing protein [Candidatus Hydrogenedentes bacterium]|nr:sulfotransferase domain-containing protein [Candidatus Hydrogenedentota bacterium]
MSDSVDRYIPLVGDRVPGVNPGSTDAVVVVSGLPRSGTSMVMAMLAAGGFPVLTDGARPADRHNPGGYYEYAPVRGTRRDVSWVEEAAGRAVKVIASLLPWLPVDRRYRVLFVTRNPLEVAVSQRRMLSGGGGEITEADRRSSRLLASHLREVVEWLRMAGHMEVCWLSHRALLRDPGVQAVRMADFLGARLDVGAMAGVSRWGWWGCRSGHIKEIFPESCNKELIPYIIPPTDLAAWSAGTGTRDVPVPAAETPRRVHRGGHFEKARLP